MSTPEILVHPDAELLAKAVAARLVTRLVDAVSATGHAHLVLTGGGIGTAVLAELAAAPARDAVDWRQVDFWWGDDRAVVVDRGHPWDQRRHMPFRADAEDQHVKRRDRAVVLGAGCGGQPAGVTGGRCLRVVAVGPIRAGHRVHPRRIEVDAVEQR